MDRTVSHALLRTVSHALLRTVSHALLRTVSHAFPLRRPAEDGVGPEFTERPQATRRRLVADVPVLHGVSKDGRSPLENGGRAGDTYGWTIHSAG